MSTPYIDAVWQQMTAKFLAGFDSLLPRQKKTLPVETVRELLRHAYQMGAQDALRMAERMEEDGS